MLEIVVPDSMLAAQPPNSTDMSSTFNFLLFINEFQRHSRNHFELDRDHGRWIPR